MDVIEEDEAPAGTPAWMATFADLMSLLMCFFVLLLSFSEMDLQKYKQVAGSMEKAFGVQNQTKVMDIPKGTSIIAQEFSPGKTTPTILDTVQQRTVETNHKALRVGDRDSKADNTTGELDSSGQHDGESEHQGEGKLDDKETRQLLADQMDFLLEETAADAEYLKSILETEIIEGNIDIEYEDRHITIRIRERGSFRSASATLAPDFIPVMAAIREALRSIKGTISVEGHTDNIPISTRRFKSNWDLSATRALSVVNELLRDGKLAEDRFMLVGYASTQPFEPNTSAENRALNRRVEIIIRQSFDGMPTDSELQLLQDGDATGDGGSPTAAIESNQTIAEASSS